MGLVDYSSDSEEDDRHTKAGTVGLKPSAKRRKILPPVPSNYLIDPGDNPALHQGRTRSRPYIPGELNAYVYISLKASKQLRITISELIAQAQTHVFGHTIHSLLETPTPSQKAGEIHISITHPLPLRRSQVDPLRIELISGVKHWARSRHVDNLKCSLAGTPTVYYNGKATGGQGEGGRAFMALRVGAGAIELNSIVDKVVHPILEKCHLPLYHTNPEYHASFAWCLVDTKAGSDSDSLSDETVDDSQSTEKAYGTKAPFSKELLEKLGLEFGPTILEKQPNGGWEVDHLVLRAGKSIYEIPLS